MKEGIAFYHVGQNASLEFYAGTKGGKKYIYTIGESDWDEKNDMPITREENVLEVEDWGYMGHY